MPATIRSWRCEVLSLWLEILKLEALPMPTVKPTVAPDAEPELDPNFRNGSRDTSTNKEFPNVRILKVTAIG